MKIKTISLENFKCHKKIENLPFEDFTMLVGENDAGKSSIIDFLDFMLANNTHIDLLFYRCQKFNEEGKPYTEEAVETIGEIVFSLDEGEQSKYKSDLDNNNNFRIKKTSNRINQTHIYELFKKKYNDAHLNGYEQKTVADLKKIITDLGVTPTGNKPELLALIENYIAENDPATTNGWVEVPFNNLKDKLPTFFRYDSEDFEDPSQMIKNTLFKVFQGELYVINEKNEFDKDENGKKKLKDQSLKDIQVNIEKKIKEKIQIFENDIKKYNSEIEGITVNPDIDFSKGLVSTPLQIKSKSHKVYTNLNSCGAGTKQRVYMSLLEWQKNISNETPEYTIRCYDEPDNNLHIDAQRKLQKILKSTALSNNKTQVVVSTHSLFMIDTAPSNSIRLLKRKECENTNINFLESDGEEIVSSFIERMCREIGLSNSHIFFEKSFLFVEGHTEEKFIPLAYKKLFGSTLAEEGIKLINTESCDSLSIFIRVMLKHRKEKIVILLDKDADNTNLNKKLRTAIKLHYDHLSDTELQAQIDDFFSNYVFYIGLNKEFEDAFPDEIWLRVFNNNIEKENNEAWILSDFSTLRSEDKFSKALTKLAKDKSKEKQPISKPDLGIFLGNELLKEEIPEELTNCFNKLKTISEENQ